MTPPDIYLLDLFTGTGMLGLAVEMMMREVVGIEVRPYAYCEMADYPRAVLNARMADGTLHRAPILRDATGLPLSDMLGRVGAICAGFPCPAVSIAGKRAAQSDDRWLWPSVADAVGALRPGLVFLENVPGIALPVKDKRGRVIAHPPAWDVVRDLSALGYWWECGLLDSESVGASHGRARWWCLAYWPGIQLADANREGLQGRGLLLQRRLDEWNTREGGPPVGPSCVGTS